MFRPLFTIGLGLVCVSGMARAQEHRQHAAHQHGHGTLSIAVEGGSVSMEFEAPGSDIAGFEHEAKSAAEKAAVAKAKAGLAEPLLLFTPPAAAQCSLKEAKVEIAGDETHDGHDGAHGHDHEHAKPSESDTHHGEYHAQYVLDCKSPSALTSLTFAYFAQFKNAQALTVNVVTPKGQSQFEVTRDKSTLDLTQLM